MTRVREVFSRAYAMLVLYEQAFQERDLDRPTFLQARFRSAARRQYLAYIHREMFPFAQRKLGPRPPPPAWDQFLDP